MSAVLDKIAPETVQVLVRQASASGLSLNEYLQKLLGLQTRLPEDLSLAESGDQANDIADFMADLEDLAEGTEHLPAPPLTYSRADIYFDHD